MGDKGVVDVVRRLIVGRRGRGRADRLVCIGADNAQRAIAVKPQANANRYVDLVGACHPVRIEAYAGKELVDVWEDDVPREAPAATPAPANERAPATPTKGSKLLRMKVRTPDEWQAQVVAVTTHVNGLLANAHREHGKELSQAHTKNADLQSGLWNSLVEIAQHHENRATNAEAKLAEAEKAIRIRDRRIREQDDAIIKLRFHIAELANTSGGDKQSDAFMKLLELAGDHPLATVARAVNGGAKQKTAAATNGTTAAATPATSPATNGKAKAKGEPS